MPPPRSPAPDPGSGSSALPGTGSGTASGSTATTGSSATSGSGSATASGSSLPDADYRSGAITSIAFDPTGAMYGLKNFGGLYSIDPTTGAVSLEVLLENSFGPSRMAIRNDGAAYMIDPFGNAGGLDLFDGTSSLVGLLTAGGYEVVGTSAITFSTEAEPFFGTKKDSGSGKTGGTGSAIATGSGSQAATGSASGSGSSALPSQFAAGTLFGMVDLYDSTTDTYSSVIGRINPLLGGTGPVTLDRTFVPTLNDGSEVRLTGMAFAPTAVVPSPAAAAGGIVLAGGYVASRIVRGRRGRRSE